jgi:ethanolamine utilization protein EutA
VSEELLSVGLDVGTTSTQMILSRLRVENRASGFAVPDLQITQREILYKSPVHFTPLQSQAQVDGEGLRHLVEQEYRSAGICRESVDTGAIIITGETSRKENAKTVLDALSDFAGDFVVAVAGPDLESILAAKGAGAVDHSERTGETVLHMDIGGGTSNLALIRAGKIVATGCLNVGGRLVKLDKHNVVTYVSPVLQNLCPIVPGQVLQPEQAEKLGQLLTRALEMAAGLRPWEDPQQTLLTREAAGQIPVPEEPVTVSFSGGVADCIGKEYPFGTFGDIGAVLGQCIRRSKLCQGKYLLGSETIRATVIGAGCHSTQLSGSTIFYRNIRFPMKNLPVVVVSDPDRLEVVRKEQEGPVVLALECAGELSYGQIRKLAEKLAPKLPQPAILCLRRDMAKALGQALAIRMDQGAGILCLDRVAVSEGSYLDIGAPVGGAIPVVVKTLVLGKESRRCL